ncbi:Bgr_08870 family protein [Bartonella ancashensis]|uniref:Bgr_08870 family protein n=1 Tax=Bartonella ancashensis TaxID=1318743 RepID=UPI0039E3FAAF
MAKTKKLEMELPKEGRFISSEFPILRENLQKIDQAIADCDEKSDRKASLQHRHTMSDVEGLETTLKSKMAANKTFLLADLKDVEGCKDAAENYVLYKASNDHFTFGSSKSLLGTHEHKIEDIRGLEAYGCLTKKNRWQEANDFQGPVTVDGKAIYTKDEAIVALQEIRDEIAQMIKAIMPLEVLMTESGSLPWPNGVTDDTDIEIWAWGAGGGGGLGIRSNGHNYGGGGGGGGQCVRTKIKGFQRRQLTIVEIGCGGIGGVSSNKGGGAGGSTRIEGIMTALGGSGGGSGAGGNGGVESSNESGKSGYGGSASSSGTHGISYIVSGGGGGNGGSGSGGSSIYSGGGGGGASANNGPGGWYGESDKGGKGGRGYKGNSGGGGGGGGYFPGEDGVANKGGNGGNGAVLLKFFL